MLRGLVSSYSTLGKLFFRRAALRVSKTLLKRAFYFFTFGLGAVKVLMVVPETTITELTLPLGGTKSKVPL